MKSHSLIESVAIAERLKTDTELNSAIGAFFLSVDRFRASLSGDGAALIAFAEHLHPQLKSEMRALAALARHYDDAVDLIEAAKASTARRCDAAMRDQAWHRLAAAERQREIEAEIPRIEAALLADARQCPSVLVDERRNLARLGVPVAVIDTLKPGMNRAAEENRLADLRIENAALSRFIVTADMRHLPSAFVADYFPAWKARQLIAA